MLKGRDGGVARWREKDGERGGAKEEETKGGEKGGAQDQTEVKDSQATEQTEVKAVGVNSLVSVVRDGRA